MNVYQELLNILYEYKGKVLVEQKDKDIEKLLSDMSLSLKIKEKYGIDINQTSCFSPIVNYFQNFLQK